MQYKRCGAVLAFECVAACFAEYEVGIPTAGDEDYELLMILLSDLQCFLEIATKDREVGITNFTAHVDNTNVSRRGSRREFFNFGNEIIERFGDARSAGGNIFF